MDIALKSVIGGVFIGFILWLSRTRLNALAGLLLFFPIISVPTFFFLGSNGPAEQMRKTIVWRRPDGGGKRFYVSQWVRHSFYLFQTAAAIGISSRINFLCGSAICGTTAGPAPSAAKSS